MLYTYPWLSLTDRHFRILKKEWLLFETWDPFDIWSERQLGQLKRQKNYWHQNHYAVWKSHQEICLQKRLRLMIEASPDFHQLITLFTLRKTLGEKLDLMGIGPIKVSIWLSIHGNSLLNITEYHCDILNKINTELHKLSPASVFPLFLSGEFKGGGISQIAVCGPPSFRLGPDMPPTSSPSTLPKPNLPNQTREWVLNIPGRYSSPLLARI